MKLLIVTSMWPSFKGQPPYSGLFVKEQVDALRAAGHDVDVTVIEAERGLLGLIRSHVRSFKARNRVRGLVLEKGYDLVHAHSGSAGLACLTARRLVPFIMTHHGEQVYYSRLGSIPFVRPVDRFVARRADRLIVVSERLAQTYHGISSTVLPCGVAPEFFNLLPATEARRQLDLAEDVRYVVFPANPERTIKNHGRFRAALAAAKKDLGELEEVVLSDTRWTRDKVPTLFAAADAMMLTSDSEGSPQVVKEAVCSGLPVISTDVGDVAIITEGVQPGAVVPFTEAGVPRSEEELTRALATELVSVIGAQSRSRGGQIARQYSNATIVARLSAIYRDAVVQRITR